jgi:Family of unknown function (DUF5329)
MRSVGKMRLGRVAVTVGMLFALTALAVADTPEEKPTPKQEVEYLLGYLHHSKCRFNRNGTWYDSEQAAEHLKKKFAYLVKKGLFTSAESFIEKGATSSSMSGKAYQVQCADQPAVASGPWLLEKLKQARQPKPNVPDTLKSPSSPPPAMQ